MGRFVLKSILLLPGLVFEYFAKTIKAKASWIEIERSLEHSIEFQIYIKLFWDKQLINTFKNVSNIFYYLLLNYNWIKI